MRCTRRFAENQGQSITESHHIDMNIITRIKKEEKG